MPVRPIHRSASDSAAAAPITNDAEPRRLAPVRSRNRPAAFTPQPHDGESQSPPADGTNDDPDSKVGYCKPPKHTQFKPGQSGNPKGRPKGAKGLKTLVRDVMSEKVAVRTATGEKKIRRIEALLRKTIELALKGNARALSQLLGLYAAAVPEGIADEGTSVTEELTTTDLAILEELKTILLQQGGEE